MATPLITRNRYLGVETEAAYGTAETLTNADAALKVQDRNLTINSEFTQRQKQGGLGYDKGVPDAYSTALTLQNHLCGSGASGGVPLWATKLLPACCMKETSGTFALTSAAADFKSLSAWAWQDGRLKKARGLMGSAVINLTNGKPGTIDWNFLGGFVETPSAASLITAPTTIEALPPIWHAASAFTLAGSTDYKASTAVIDLGTNIALREDPNSPGGYIGGWPSDFTPTVTIDPEAQAYGTRNWDADYFAGNVVTAVFVLNGGSNNTITITATDMQLNAPATEADRGGRLVDSLVFNVTGTLSIAFT